MAWNPWFLYYSSSRCSKRESAMSAHNCNKCDRLHLIKWKNDTNVIKKLVFLKCEVFGCGGLVIDQMSNKEIESVDVQSLMLKEENGVNEEVKTFELALEK